jgi:hypothetical protein
MAAISPVLTPFRLPVLTTADTGARTGDDGVGATAFEPDIGIDEGQRTG